MIVPERDKARFEELDEGRRRVYEDVNLLVQQMREGSISDVARLRLQAQRLGVRHEGLIEEMIALLIY